MDSERSAITEPVRRLEVFTGAERRSWSADDKALIVAESLTGEASVCAVARRNGLSPQQLFGWCRQLQQEAESVEPQALAVNEAATRELGPKRVKRRPTRRQ